MAKVVNNATMQHIATKSDKISDVNWDNAMLLAPPDTASGGWSVTSLLAFRDADEDALLSGDSTGSTSSVASSLCESVSPEVSRGKPDTTSPVSRLSNNAPGKVEDDEDGS
ncbi:hypothetical protein PG991_000702 [Apiospora marii]|uniref:Uncharacterized protein n=1 Tax=Apiospora marii TaxID=335849 RepID=A0ABR1SU46_9PEZI